MGERRFPDTELSNCDLSGMVLDGADFEKHSWFADANFSGASLRGTSFRGCNVKCASCAAHGAYRSPRRTEQIAIGARRLPYGRVV